MDEALPTRKLFPEFGLRMVAVALDFVFVLFVTQWLRDWVISPLGLDAVNQRLLVSVILFTYFVCAWLSPMRATPAQFLFAMRVVDEQGRTLTCLSASIRALVLVGLITATFAIFEVPVRVWLVLTALAAYSLLFIAALTPNRQALHDKLAKSLVVSKTALRQKYVGQLRAHVANIQSQSWLQRRPSILSIGANLFVLVVPVIVLTNVAAINNTKDLYARLAYAVSETQDMKIAIAEYYYEHDDWPDRDAEIGMQRSVNYPDGGFYELLDNGEILIRFTVRPELVNGALRMTPIVSDSGIEWQCRPEGELERVIVPVMCRE